MNEQTINLAALSSLGTASEHASASFLAALTADGLVVRRTNAAHDHDSEALLINLVLASAADKQIHLEPSHLPTEPESFAIRKTDRSEQQSVYVVGHDDIGLAYGIFELLGQLQSHPGSPLLHRVSSVCRAPRLPVRSVCILLYNRDLEKEWLYSRDHWNSYFELLARSRFNHFTLITGHHTSYLTPPFPFMVDVPGYDHVKVPSYTDQERRQNLEMLQMVSTLAAEWGIKFVLGIWQQQALHKDPKAGGYLLYTRYQQDLHRFGHGDNMVEGLTYDDLFDYCPKALGILLQQCPNIRGVQFRMNWESGIGEDEQATFYRGIFEAIANCGRPMWVDLRAKGLTDETINVASEMGLDLVVSTKFWREHMGLPYHAAENNAWDIGREYRRYGYWDLLHQDKPYKILYRLWFGSQKILLWGDLGYVNRFAESCELGAGLGFEVCAPLSEKGFHNWPGGSWHVVADRDFEHYRWEFQRYWGFYLAFGLGGYCRNVTQPILEAEFVRRFGEKAAPEIRRAYQAASGVLPLVTAFHGPSSNDLVYWPEMDIGGLTEAYIGTSAGDPGRFYTIYEYVSDYLQGIAAGKLTPLEVAARFVHLGARIRAALRRAADQITSPASNREWRLTRIDLESLAELSEYHGARILSAQRFEFFRKIGDRASLRGAIRYAQAALRRWHRIVELTDGVYYDHMVFNEPPNQIGHWKDLLPLLIHDVRRLEEIDRLFLAYCARPNATASLRPSLPWYQQPLEWAEQDGVLSRSVGEIVPAEPLEYPFYEQRGNEHVVQAPEAVIQDLFKRFEELTVVHVPIRFSEGDREIPIRASIIGSRHDIEINLRYTIAERDGTFESAKLLEHHENVYVGFLPATEPGLTIHYFIEARASGRALPVVHGTEQNPHVVRLGYRGEKPLIVHQPPLHCAFGKPLGITATVHSSAALHHVHLHYRHLIQSESWTVIAMTEAAGGAYAASIPGSHMRIGWDLMYAIEAVDECGNGTFHPDMDVRQPFFVVSVRSL